MSKKTSEQKREAWAPKVGLRNGDFEANTPMGKGANPSSGEAVDDHLGGQGHWRGGPKIG